MTRLRNRRGVSLLETMATTSLISTLLLLSAGWIHQSMKFASIMRQRQEQHQSFLRLSGQFRDDVHHSQSMVLEREDRLVIQLPADRQVAYSVQDGRVLRRMRSPADPPSEDAFGLPAGATLRWDDSELPQWISLTVDRAESMPDLYLRAAVHRFGDGGEAGPRTAGEENGT